MSSSLPDFSYTYPLPSVIHRRPYFTEADFVWQICSNSPMANFIEKFGMPSQWKDDDALKYWEEEASKAWNNYVSTSDFFSFFKLDVDISRRGACPLGTHILLVAPLIRKTNEKDETKTTEVPFSRILWEQKKSCPLSSICDFLESENPLEKLADTLLDPCHAKPYLSRVEELLQLILRVKAIRSDRFYEFRSLQAQIMSKWLLERLPRSRVSGLFNVLDKTYMKYSNADWTVLKLQDLCNSLNVRIAKEPSVLSQALHSDLLVVLRTMCKVRDKKFEVSSPLFLWATLVISEYASQMTRDTNCLDWMQEDYHFLKDTEESIETSFWADLQCKLIQDSVLPFPVSKKHKEEEKNYEKQSKSLTNMLDQTLNDLLLSYTAYTDGIYELPSIICAHKEEIFLQKAKTYKKLAVWNTIYNTWKNMKMGTEQELSIIYSSNCPAQIITLRKCFSDEF